MTGLSGLRNLSVSIRKEVRLTNDEALLGRRWAKESQGMEGKGRERRRLCKLNRAQLIDWCFVKCCLSLLINGLHCRTDQLIFAYIFSLDYSVGYSGWSFCCTRQTAGTDCASWITVSLRYQIRPRRYNYRPPQTSYSFNKKSQFKVAILWSWESGSFLELQQKKEMQTSFCQSLKIFSEKNSPQNLLRKAGLITSD
jgi:hypothetical protein